MTTIQKKIDPLNVPGFSPLGMTGLDLWLDGNDPSTMYNASNGGANVANGGFIYRWEDKSGNGNHVYTITGGQLSQPQYYANLTNNLGGLTFSNSVLTNLVQAPYPVDVYMVLSLCNYNNIGISALTNANMNVFCVKYPGGQFGSNKDWNSLAYGLVNNPRSINYSQKWVINSSNYSRTCNVVPSVQETSMGFIMLNWGISNSDYHIKRYATTLAETTSYSTWTTYANSNTAFRYYVGGIDYSSTDSNFNGSICEIISFSNLLNTTNRTKIESYLANKWNLPIFMPVTHPGHLTKSPLSLGGTSLADAPNQYTRIAAMKQIRTPPPPILGVPSVWAGAITISLTGSAESYDIILKQSTNDITYINYLTFLTQQLQTNTFSYTLMPSPFELGKYYKFSIRAKSGPLASVYVESQTVYAPYLPGIPTPSDSDTNGNLYQIYWNASSGPNEGTPTNYSVQIYRNTGSYTLETTIFTLTNQTDYEYSVSITGYYKYSVAAVNESGQSAYSALAGERYVTYTPGL